MCAIHPELPSVLVWGRDPSVTVLKDWGLRPASNTGISTGAFQRMLRDRDFDSTQEGCNPALLLCSCEDGRVSVSLSLSFHIHKMHPFLHRPSLALSICLSPLSSRKVLEPLQLDTISPFSGHQASFQALNLQSMSHWVPRQTLPWNFLLCPQISSVSFPVSLVASGAGLCSSESPHEAAWRAHYPKTGTPEGLPRHHEQGNCITGFLQLWDPLWPRHYQHAPVMQGRHQYTNQ